ncbi:MAG: thioredoxin family protein [Clostridiales bacterium]|nr:thioredoxin family protein [Clostridiales bacterium]MDD7432555.1 thioredoxin family protein [Clostridiales bacterium]MDY3062132.1 thioredoxin family protein [Eubacteriales bacterium]
MNTNQQVQEFTSRETAKGSRGLRLGLLLLFVAAVAFALAACSSANMSSSTAPSSASLPLSTTLSESRPSTPQTSSSPSKSQSQSTERVIMDQTPITLPAAEFEKMAAAAIEENAVSWELTPEGGDFASLPTEPLPVDGEEVNPVVTPEVTPEPTPAPTPETTPVPTEAAVQLPGVTIHNSSHPLKKDLSAWLKKSVLPVLIDVSQDGCPPCDQAEPVIRQLAQKYDGRLIVMTINVSQYFGSMPFYPTSTPTFAVFVGGYQQQTLAGYGGAGELENLAASALGG